MRQSKLSSSVTTMRYALGLSNDEHQYGRKVEEADHRPFW